MSQYFSFDIIAYRMSRSRIDIFPLEILHSSDLAKGKMHYNFTDRTRKVLAFARDEAIRLGHDHVGTEHILLGLIREGQGVAAAVLMNLEIDLPGVTERVEELTSRGTTPGAGDLPYTSGAREVLNFTSNEAQELNHAYIGTEHVLLGLLREENGIPAQALRSFGLHLKLPETRSADSWAAHSSALSMAGDTEQVLSSANLQHCSRAS